MPKDFKPRTDVPLSRPLRRPWPPASSGDRRLTHQPLARMAASFIPYGAGMPTVVCAPLRVCIVEMEPGEKIVGEPHIGESF
jgi:type IV secretion system protein VirB9